MRLVQRLMVGLSLLSVGTTVLAQDSWETPNEQVTGEELFAACALCHGTTAQGSKRRDAPALAGLEPWYLERQMHNFRNGLRGTRYEDIPGQVMYYSVGLFRNEETIKSLAQYISTFEPGLPLDGNQISERPYVWDSPYAGLDPAISGDAEAGKTTYTSICVVCHGADGSGNEALGAGNIRYLSDDYMIRQLQYFRDGIRGAHPDDTLGQQMAAMSKVLAGDQGIADVVAYISGL